MTTAPQIVFPDWYNSDYAEFEVESKGFVTGVRVRYGDHPEVSLTFYDSTRLSQDVDSEGFVFEPNLVVLRSVTREHIVAAIDTIIEQNRFLLLAQTTTVARSNAPDSSQD